MLRRKRLIVSLACMVIYSASSALVPSQASATEQTSVKNNNKIESFSATTFQLQPLQDQLTRDLAKQEMKNKIQKLESDKKKAEEERIKQEELKKQAEEEEAKQKAEQERLDKIKKELEAKGTDEKKKAEILKGQEELDKRKGTAECKEFTLTFYTSLASENGNDLAVNCHGKPLADGMVASNCLPQGTKLYLEGMGNFEVADTGSPLYFSSESRLDVFVPRLEGETDEEYSNRVMGYGVKHVYGYVIDDSSLKVISDSLPPSAPKSEAPTEAKTSEIKASTSQENPTSVDNNSSVKTEVNEDKDVSKEIKTAGLNQSLPSTPAVVNNAQLGNKQPSVASAEKTAEPVAEQKK